MLLSQNVPPYWAQEKWRLCILQDMQSLKAHVSWTKLNFWLAFPKWSKSSAFAETVRTEFANIVLKTALTGTGFPAETDLSEKIQRANGKVWVEWRNLGWGWPSPSWTGRKLR
jgi:hypothetical protein